MPQIHWVFKQKALKQQILFVVFSEFFLQKRFKKHDIYYSKFSYQILQTKLQRELKHRPMVETIYSVCYWNVSLGFDSGRVDPKTMKLVFTASLLDFEELKGLWEASNVSSRQVGTGQVDRWHSKTAKVPSELPGKGSSGWMFYCYLFCGN